MENLAFPLGRERDACGIGAVSVGSGEITRRPLNMALKAVCNFEHRGACMPDGTGDGTGFLMDIPRNFLAREIWRMAPLVDGAFKGNGWGVVTLFLPADLNPKYPKEAAEKTFLAMGMDAVLWRDVPVNLGSLGPLARSGAPRIVQIVIRWNEFSDDMETMRFLFKARRRLENAFEADNLPVYISSLSDRTIVYKGLMAGHQFGEVFPDLQDPSFKVSTVVFHRRFATNTAPNWNMCQPFRLLCHNGEINTIDGNRHAVRMWERYVANCGKFESDWPANVLIPGQSDSADLDGALSAYHAEGRSLSYTAAILMPPSWENRVRNLSPEMKAFFEFHKRALGGMGAWEGPAAILAYDGRQLVASLDRMGLRPLRVSQSRDGTFLAASENGIFEQDPDQIVLRAQLIPGDIFRYDLDKRKAVQSVDVYTEIIRESASKLKTTFREANHKQIRDPSRYGIPENETHPDLAAFRGRMGPFLRAWGWDSKLRLESLNHLIDVGKEDIYSMGYDRAMPFLSADGPPLFRYFQQRFALVTNPPIDPYREGMDMSMMTYLGRMPDVPPRTSPGAVNLRLKSPILTGRTMSEILESTDMPARRIPLLFKEGGTGADLKAALDEVVRLSLKAIADDVHVLVLSDRGCFGAGSSPIPAAPAVSAVHHRITEAGLRPLCSIVVESGEVSEGHDVAVLLGLGASAVYPHALFHYAMHRSRVTGRPAGSAIRNVLEGLEESVRKIMSKMGIATIQGYRDSCLFEAVGLGPDVMEYLPRIPSRVGGVSLDTVAADIAHRVRCARSLDELPEYDSDERTYNDPLRMALWRVSRTGTRDDWERYRKIAGSRRPSVIRDLLEIQTPPNVEEQPPLLAQTVLRECVTGAAMSHGALTRKAHEAIAEAGNRIGMKTNSGEGGEDRERNHRGPKAHLRSRIRQVSTGRFGVDAEYLVNADEIQIKMAQGAKPGEGGQLMSSKVTAEIAGLRYCRPGINLISPPPHHDIYSIEDLKQLIYDLRAINPAALISVKLAAVTGIGTIAAGVVKAGADIIEIDGLEGSTGAAPRSSLEHAGLPSELGLRETHVALTRLGMRSIVKLRAGGGIKTEDDAVKYMLLGADQVSIATTLMIAQGCIHCNCCHTGRCPTMIAGSLNRRAIYPGSSRHVERFLLAFGQAIADLVAKLGFRHPRELVGHVELLRPRTREELARNLRESYSLDPERFLDRCMLPDLAFFTTPIPDETGTARRESIDNLDYSVRKLIEGDVDLGRAIQEGRPVHRSYEVSSCNSVDFAVTVAGRIASKWGRDGWPGKEIQLKTEGTAGQSYGAFCVKGIRLTHVGSCNDGVAKGMSGGSVAILQPQGFDGISWQTTLVGNNVAFGATGGKLFVQGRAGQRLGVRNSGATIVCEGAGLYACEYMTSGTAVFLGPVGDAIGAGMTDGKIFIYDPEGSQEIRFMIHSESVAIMRPSEEELYSELLPLLDEYFSVTGSARAEEARHNLYEFFKVIPVAVLAEEMKKKLAVDLGQTIAG